jgi:hypothetical protein
MLDLDENLDMRRTAMGFHYIVDTSMCCNSWENNYKEAVPFDHVYVDMVLVYYLRNMLACFHLEENDMHKSS